MPEGGWSSGTWGQAGWGCSVYDRAASDSAKYPAKVISSLAFPFQQKSWLQIKDKQQRFEIRDRICQLLISAFNRTNKHADAIIVQQYLQLENEAYQHNN